MKSTRFTATLLRQGAGGFAGLIAGRTLARIGVERDGEFDAWREHFRTLVLELAAAVDDGSSDQFARQVEWTRAAFVERGLETEALQVGLAAVGEVLEEELPPQALDPIPSFLRAAQLEIEASPRASEPEDSPYASLVEGFLDDLRGWDAAAGTHRVLDTIARGGLTVADALEEVLPAILREVGRRWHTAAVNVAGEHFTTQTVGRLIGRLVELGPPLEREAPKVLLSMIAGDAHELGLRIVAALFELDGWRTVCLGANTPIEDLTQCAQEFDPDLVALGATLNTQRAVVARAIERLRAERPGQAVLVGGSAFAGLSETAGEVGADAHATSPRDAVRRARALLERT